MPPALRAFGLAALALLLGGGLAYAPDLIGQIQHRGILEDALTGPAPFRCEPGNTLVLEHGPPDARAPRVGDRWVVWSAGEPLKPGVPDPDLDVFAHEVSTGKVRALADTTDTELMPVVDGALVVWKVMPEDGHTLLRAMNLTTGHRWTIPHVYPWHVHGVDGNLALVRGFHEATNRTGLHLVDVKTQSATYLTNVSGTWDDASLDGGRAVWAEYGDEAPGGVSRLRLHDSATGETRTLVETKGQVRAPHLAGQKLAFIRGGSVHLLDLGTGEERLVAESDGFRSMGNPRVSGDWVLYADTVKGGLHAYHALAGNVLQVTDDPMQPRVDLRDRVVAYARLDLRTGANRVALTCLPATP